MKKSHLIMATILAAAMCTASVINYAGAADTSSDPLVTMSYVEEVLEPKMMEELKSYIQNNLHSTSATGDGSVDASYSVVHMTKGQVLYPLSATEIILRSGKAEVLSAFMDQGINDMTDGSELYNGSELPRYHYCLIPRGDDGRSIVAVTDEIYIMVRGDFEIREQ